MRRGAAVVDRRAPYQWTPATRSRSVFIHDGRVNGVRAGRPRLAAVAHVREKMARRRDDDGRRAKTTGRTSVVMARSVRCASTRGHGGSPRARASPRFRSCCRHFLRAESRSAFGRYAQRSARLRRPFW
ncbi:jg7070 [Pararge aegeria aegeria]|uniref:Jg7070 protein n=1 Tax=Pararge aegeria aegeria TaxID=348720 RepID=A0A8S4S0I3_9NEOP|nr:jg7070 [Pararge aegeria aegeria]